VPQLRGRPAGRGLNPNVGTDLIARRLNAGSAQEILMRKRKFTPQVVEEIRSEAAQGKSPEEIAMRIGCTGGTLKVRCSEFGISLRRKKVASKQLELSIPLSPMVVEELRSCAQARKLAVRDLASTLLERIVVEDLVAAVLDDD
jgi:hypothetical protein